MSGQLLTIPERVLGDKAVAFGLGLEFNQLTLLVIDL